MKYLISLVFCIFFWSISYAANIIEQSGEVPIDPTLLPSIVKIESFSELQKKEITGTGFFVSVEVIDGQEKKRAVFLVTNKHMVSDWTLADGNITKFNKNLKVYFYRSEFSPENPTSPLNVQLYENNNLIPNKILANSNPFVDVAVVLLNFDLSKSTGITTPSFDASYLLPFAKITSYYTNIGSHVYVLGYPFGITSLRSNYPIAKSGYIASTPGEDFSIILKSYDRAGLEKNVKMAGNLLVIDGLIVPGNSGGPVILPSEVKSRIDPKTKSWQHLTKPTENLVIGILAGGFGTSGLSYVYSTNYIVETIQELLKAYNLKPIKDWNSVLTEQAAERTSP